MPSETLAGLVDAVEHPAKVPTTANASKDKYVWNVFIFLLRYGIG
jgi:hypothetical protein